MRTTSRTSACFFHFEFFFRDFVSPPPPLSQAFSEKEKTLPLLLTSENIPHDQSRSRKSAPMQPSTLRTRLAAFVSVYSSTCF